MLFNFLEKFVEFSAKMQIDTKTYEFVFRMFWNEDHKESSEFQHMALNAIQAINPRKLQGKVCAYGGKERTQNQIDKLDSWLIEIAERSFITLNFIDFPVGERKSRIGGTKKQKADKYQLYLAFKSGKVKREEYEVVVKALGLNLVDLVDLNGEKVVVN